MGEKDAGLRIRVERTLRDRFRKACQAEDRPAAQVLRAFMRDYVAAYEATTTKPARSRQGNRSKGDSR
jgi:hypothetical protein